jgi:peptidoglycan/LPS O-acetylase OafA/YrhL
MNYFLEIFRYNPKEINSLNGIRAILIHVLFFGHMFTMASNANKMEALPEYLSIFCRNVSFIIDGFFCLSGYLISGPLLKELDRKGDLDLRSFFIRRTFRIFPSYYFLLSIQFLMVWFMLKMATKPEQVELLSNGIKLFLNDLFYISNYSRGVLPHGWSLSLEEQFYVCFPFFLILFFKHIPKIYRLATLLTLYLLPLGFRIYIYYTHLINFPPDVEWIHYEELIYKPFHTHVDSIIIGIIIAYVLQNHRSWVNFIFSGSASSRILNFCLWILLFWYNFTFNELNPGFFEQVFRYNVMNIIFAFIFIYSMNEKELFNKFLSNRVFAPIAKLSYIAYLLHMLMLGYLMYPLSKQPVITLNDILIHLFPFSFAIFFISYLVYLITEKPFAILKDKMTKDYKKESLPGINN